MKAHRKFWAISLLVVLTMLFTACGGGGESLANEIRLNLETEPPTADPALATDSTSIQVDELLFLGLTDFDDKTLDVIPELAEKWDASADGLTWTFYMRKDVVWVQYDPQSQEVADKGPVTAYDVEYAVKRTLDPATASDYAYVDYIIENAYEFNTGEIADAAAVGVKALDEWTVQFTLQQPAGYFPGIAGMWINRPVPREPIEQHGDKWTEPGNIWVNGPYLMESWEHENIMEMVKNPKYYDAKDVSIERIHWAMVVEDSTAFAMYENGELDVSDVPLPDMDRVRADPVLSKELYIAPSLCTYYYGFNVTKPPFDNALVRKAFSLAFDREKLVETVTKGGQKPAKSLACPGIFGSPAEDPNFPALNYDPDEAKRLLAEAGFPNGQGLPEIVLLYNTGEGHQLIAEFIQQSWKETLGVDVKLANQEWKVFLKTLIEDAPQVYRDGWCADYPDENNWLLELYHSELGSNYIRWDNPEFNRLVEEAAAESDPAKRKDLYYQAEKILVQDEAGIIPIYYYTRVVCSKPYVERTYAPLGGEHVDKWEVKAH